MTFCEQTAGNLVFCTNDLDAMPDTKGLSTERTKALYNKAHPCTDGIAIGLLLSSLLCMCHGQYSMHCIALKIRISM